MPRHSRNNTALGHFTHAEYQMLQDEWGSRRQRLGRDSMRNFDACTLCLQTARDPVSCGEGHLYCKECILTNLLQQKKDIKRKRATLERMMREEEEERQRAREEARARVVKDFEQSQLGLGARKRLKGSEGEARAAGERGAGEDGNGESAGATPSSKRKFNFDAEEVSRLQTAAEEAAMRKIEAEQAEARKAKLPDFWLPSLTPDAAAGPLKDVKLGTVCQATTPPHTLAVKNLIDILFTFSSSTASTPASTTPTPVASSEGADAASGKPPTPLGAASQTEKRIICPSCKKGFSNSTTLILVKPCGHVVCKTCVDTLMKEAKQCVVCSGKAREKDLVEIKKEGTGYAGGGLAETRKKGVAFQG